MRPLLIVFCLALGCLTVSANAQLDPASIRRKAAEVAERKTLLADPDANARLLAMQQAIASPDPAIRGLTIQTGLASNETDLVNTALRGTLTGCSTMLIQYEPPKQRGRSVPAVDEPPIGTRQNATLILTTTAFDPATGRVAGVSTCPQSTVGEWTGAVLSSAMTFVTQRNTCHARLEWSAEANEFRGLLTVSCNPAGANLLASWNPN